MGLFYRKLQKNERNGAFLLHIPVALILGMGWKKGDMLEIDDFDGDEIKIRIKK